MLFILIILIGLQSCILHPPYERPCMEMPDHWRIDTDEASTYANNKWWEQFNDPALNCLIHDAIEHNKDLRVAIVRINEFVGNLLVARSNLYPQISGMASVFRQEYPTSLSMFADAPRTLTLYTALFNGSYDFDLWGKIRSGSEAALAALIGSVEARRTVVMNVVTSVAATYMELRQFDKQLQISKQTWQSRKESYDLAVARFEGGLTSELEPMQAKAEMETAEAQILEFEIEIAFHENLLSVLLGHPPEAIERGLDLYDFVLPLCVPAGIPSDILDQRPDIREAEQALIAANANIGVARAQFFPDISLTGFYGNQSLQLNSLFTGPGLTWQYGATITQPIFTGWQLTGQLEIAEAQKWEAYYLYQQSVLRAFKEVNDALIAHQKTKELLVVVGRRVDALKEALHLAELQYNNGQVDYLNVLDSQRLLFDAQLDEALIKSRTFLSLIGLYKALGGGWVIDQDNEIANEG